MFEEDVKKSKLKAYGVGTDEFRAHDFAVLCKVGEEGLMEPEDAIAQLALDYVNTTGEERRYLRDLIMKVEYKDDPIRSDYVTPDQIGKFKSPKIELKPDFSPGRQTMAQLFENYLRGEFGGGDGTKIKKSKIAEFGHLEKSAAENFSKALRDGANRRGATFEFMAICCLYFHVEPVYAITLFHKCIGIGELMEYRFLGGALWLFLEDECYDYELYVKTCCEMLKTDHYPLPDSVARSRYWNEVYDSI